MIVIYLSGLLTYPMKTPNDFAIGIKRILAREDTTIKDGAEIAQGICDVHGKHDSRHKTRRHSTIDTLFYEAKNLITICDGVIGIEMDIRKAYAPDLLMAIDRCLPALILTPEAVNEIEVLPFPYSLPEVKLVCSTDLTIIQQEISLFIKQLKENSIESED